MTEGASTSRAVPSKHDTMANQPWIEKYRPQTLDDVAANKEILGTIKRLTDENRLPHLLLYGPPGLNPYPCAESLPVQRGARLLMQYEVSQDAMRNLLQGQGRHPQCWRLPGSCMGRICRK